MPYKKLSGNVVISIRVLIYLGILEIHTRRICINKLSYINVILISCHKENLYLDFRTRTFENQVYANNLSIYAVMPAHYVIST